MYKHCIFFLSVPFSARFNRWGLSALLKGSSEVNAEEEERVIYSLSQLVRGFKVLTLQ